MAKSAVFPFAQRPVGRDARLNLRSSVSRVSAAVRIPDPHHSQVEVPFPSGNPQIFVHEGARQLLERRISAAARKVVILSVTDNCRAVIAFSERKGIIRARLHHMFLDAPASVQSALVRYVAIRDPDASVVVDQYIEENNHKIRAIQPFLRPLITKGVVHDLLSISSAVNDGYFNGGISALITWGRVGPRPSDKPRSTIKLGSYSAVERLIRIHPVLDKPWVPRYFVSYIIYHEMLHHVIPPVDEGGRRNLHPPHFLEQERLFRDYGRAIAWEQAHIAKLLRSKA